MKQCVSAALARWLGRQDSNLPQLLEITTGDSEDRGCNRPAAGPQARAILTSLGVGP